MGLTAFQILILVFRSKKICIWNSTTGIHIAIRQELQGNNCTERSSCYRWRPRKTSRRVTSQAATPWRVTSHCSLPRESARLDGRMLSAVRAAIYVLIETHNPTAIHVLHINWYASFLPPTPLATPINYVIMGFGTNQPSTPSIFEKTCEEKREIR